MRTCLLENGSVALSKEASKFVPAQRFAGMQVIDNRGTLVGNVKDVSVDFRNKALAFRVTTKAHTDTDMSWDDVLSVEDVVLLKKEVQLPACDTGSGSACNRAGCHDLSKLRDLSSRPCEVLPQVRGKSEVANGLSLSFRWRLPYRVDFGFPESL